MRIYDIQQTLLEKGYAPGTADDRWGPRTDAAVAKAMDDYSVLSYKNWGPNRRVVAAEQLALRMHGIEPGKIDGLVGPSTQHARSVWEWRQRMVGPNPSDWRDTPSPTLVTPRKNVWPLQSEVSNFYGKVGVNQVSLVLPYPMRIAWDLGTTIKRFSVHEKVHDSALRCLTRVADTYSDEERRRHGLDKFGGCLNVRQMRGGKAMSMHSWGIAIDFDPERNQLRWGRELAYLARPELEAFWRIWEDEGWLSLGRAKNYDWMHVQAARL